MVCILLSIKEKSKRACLYGFKQFGNQLLPCFSKHTLTLVQTQCSVCPQITSCGVHWQADSLSPFRNTWKREAERDTEQASKPGLSVLRGLPRRSAGAAACAVPDPPPPPLSLLSELFSPHFLSVSGFLPSHILNVGCCKTACVPTVFSSSVCVISTFLTFSSSSPLPPFLTALFS